MPVDVCRRVVRTGMGWRGAALGLALCLGAMPAGASDFKPLALVAKPLMQTSTTWAGQPLAYPQGQAEISAMEITLAPGAETGWHSHPVASYAYVLEGELEITLEDGRQHRAHRGQALAEVVGLAHNGRNVGEGPVRLIVFYTATPGATLTQAAPR
ncbi:MAG: cupin domain-containing protein [Pigmentiphaga sp.]|nr:cupin domain-containing protein [Pigmentiphaga sp.]